MVPLETLGFAAWGTIGELGGCRILRVLAEKVLTVPERGAENRPYTLLDRCEGTKSR